MGLRRTVQVANSSSRFLSRAGKVSLMPSSMMLFDFTIASSQTRIIRSASAWGANVFSLDIRNSETNGTSLQHRPLGICMASTEGKPAHSPLP